MREVNWKLLGFQREVIRIKRYQEREKRDAKSAVIFIELGIKKFNSITTWTERKQPVSFK
jgi:hypothetical protein